MSIEAPTPLSETIQPLLGRTARYADNSKPDWSFYLFFRIRQQNPNLDKLLDKVIDHATKQKSTASKDWANATSALSEPEREEDEKTEPSPKYADFLNMATREFHDALPGWASRLIKALDGDPKTVSSGFDKMIAALDKALDAKPPAKGPGLPLRPDVAKRAVELALSALKAVGEAWTLPPAEAGLHIHRSGLVAVALYDALRQMRVGPDGLALDPAPTSIGYTWRGLKRLRVHPMTLDTFPPVFREGMARRAERLGDTDSSAPDTWDGSLGLDSVHGVLNGGFQIGDPAHRPLDADWRKIYDQLALMNARKGTEGQALRLAITLLYAQLGMEPVHIEIGVNPYEIGENGEALKPDIRREHFGFRDGVSQPFVDLGLGTPPAGGGTANQERRLGARRTGRNLPRARR